MISVFRTDRLNCIFIFSTAFTSVFKINLNFPIFLDHLIKPSCAWYGFSPHLSNFPISFLNENKTFSSLADENLCTFKKHKVGTMGHNYWIASVRQHKWCEHTVVHYDVDEEHFFSILLLPLVIMPSCTTFSKIFFFKRFLLVAMISYFLNIDFFLQFQQSLEK